MQRPCRLKKRRIGILVEDRRLKWAVSQTLMESGAEVFTAATKQDMQLMVEAIGLDLVLVALSRLRRNRGTPSLSLLHAGPNGPRAVPSEDDES